MISLHLFLLIIPLPNMPSKILSFCAVALCCALFASQPDVGASNLKPIVSQKATSSQAAILDSIQAAGRPLNILISTTMGSRTHAASQLSIADALTARGHKVAFAGYNDTLSSWLKPHPLVHPLSMGNNPMHTPEFQTIAKELFPPDGDVDMIKMMIAIMELNMNHYKDQFQFYHQWIQENPVDVMICNFFSSECYDAAYETGTPFVITAFMLGLFGKCSR
jgi:hypothetical protein